MSITIDPYQVFGIPRDSSLRLIKKRFRKLTLKYHPDRNRHEPDYDPSFYKKIIKSYKVLSDSQLKRQYDKQSSMTHQQLTQDYQRFEQETTDRQQAPIYHQFNNSDNEQFNQIFEQQRSADPNDHGYGNKMMNRVNISNIHQRDNLPSHQRIAESQFDTLFEQHVDLQQKHNKHIIELLNSDPTHNDLHRGDFTDIAIYNGIIIVGNDKKDYTKASNDGLNYADYEKGFNLKSSQISKDTKQKYIKHARDPLDSQYESKLQQSKQPKTSSKNWADNESLLNQQRNQSFTNLEKQNEKIVLKYKNQYPHQFITQMSQSRNNPQQNPQRNTQQSNRDNRESSYINDRLFSSTQPALKHLY